MSPVHIRTSLSAYAVRHPDRLSRSSPQHSTHLVRGDQAPAAAQYHRPTSHSILIRSRLVRPNKEARPGLVNGESRRFRLAPITSQGQDQCGRTQHIGGGHTSRWLSIHSTTGSWSWRKLHTNPNVLVSAYFMIF